MPYRSKLATTSKSVCRSAAPCGQALIETLVSLPVLIMLLFSTFLVGATFFTAYRAANAVREPIMNKLAIANNAGAVGTGDLLGMMQAINDGSFAFDGAGPSIDGLQLADVNTVTAYLVGNKTFNANSTLFPNFQFFVAQGIDSRLLMANQGATVPLNIRPTGFNPVSIDQLGYTEPLTGLAIDITDTCELITPPAPAEPVPDPLAPPPVYSPPVSADPPPTEPVACDSAEAETERQTACAAEYATYVTNGGLETEAVYMEACQASKAESCASNNAALSTQALETLVSQMQAAGVCQPSSAADDVTFPTGQPIPY